MYRFINLSRCQSLIKHSKSRLQNFFQPCLHTVRHDTTLTQSCVVRVRLSPAPFSPFPAWRCSRGYCGRSQHSPEGSWHHSYCNNNRRHQTSDCMRSQSCNFRWLQEHKQSPHSNTYVTIFLSKKYWSFLAPMTRRRETSSLSIWKKRYLSSVKKGTAGLASCATVLPGWI